MSAHAHRLKLRRLTAWLAVLSMLAMGLVAGGAAKPAKADTSPPAGTPATVSADALPTWQINGVVWSQVTVGNTVYATGEFSTARPPGVAPGGPGEVPVGNLIAYDIRTGDRISSFSHVLNAQGLVIAKSPDESRIYVGGDFTTVDGEARSHVAAFDTRTGELVGSFNPDVNGQVKAIAATNSTVYVGGAFMSANRHARTRLAAFGADDGAMKLGWAPSADDGYVWSLLVTPDQSKVVVGGQFQHLSGTVVNGMTAVDATTGAVQPWAANRTISDYHRGAIMGLSTDGEQIYGSGFATGGGAKFEGEFALDPDTGEINWLNDCQGDTYDTQPIGNVLYTVSHVHNCAMIGGFPQSRVTAVNKRHSLAFTTYPTGTNGGPDMYGWNYKGLPASQLLQWFPEFYTGHYTGQGQAAWSVTGNDDYVALGGEFPGLKEAGSQQGLVRFAVRSQAPNKRGPTAAPDAASPQAASVTPQSARISWQAAYDMDNENLTYEVYRSGTADPVHTTTGNSTFWAHGAMRFVDHGLAPGSTHTYTVKVSDPFGNTLTLPRTDSVTATTGSQSAYSRDVVDAGASAYWRLGEPSGSAVLDWAGFNDATAGPDVRRGTAGAIQGDADRASTFVGSTSSVVATNATAPTTPSFTVAAWIRTTTRSGGKIVGYGNAKSGSSSRFDRHVYMDDSGHLIFGVHPGVTRTLQTSAAYNDGEWHQVVASLDEQEGTVFYVDGKRVASDPATTSAQDYTGYWRIGGDSLNGWPNRPSSDYFAGSIDDVAVYPDALTLTQVQQQFRDSGRTLDIPAPPTDPYGKTVYGSQPEFYWRLGEGGGPTAHDTSPHEADGTYHGAVSYGVSGAVKDTTDTAIAMDGDGAFVAGNMSVPAPHTYSEELWFRTDTTEGGRLIGFGDSATGLSTKSDRHVYLQPSGRLTFGVWPGSATTITSPQAYNDGTWHHLVATQGPDGMRLYVDGSQVAADPQTNAQDYSGYWRVGGDKSWAGADFFRGELDEAAVYSSVLSAADVRAHYQAGQAVPPNNDPSAVFTSAVSGLTASFDGSGSSDQDGSVASYAWNFGDGSPAGSGAKPEHTYAEAGTYPVTLTVTDDRGATGAVSHDVTVTAGGQEGLLAEDSFGRSTTVGWGSADTGGAWSLNGSASDFQVAGGTGNVSVTRPGSAPSAALDSVSSTDTDVGARVSLDKLANGGGAYLYLIGRGTVQNGYWEKVVVSSTGAVRVYLCRVVDRTETVLDVRTVPGLTYTPGVALQLRMQAVGTSPTNLKAKVWRAGTTEPPDWQLQTTDSTAALQAPGGVALRTYLSGSATNAPIVYSFDDLVARSTG